MDIKRLGGHWRDENGNYHASTQMFPNSNIFENAKFGDKFRTRDGKMAVFISSDYESEEVIMNYNGNVHNVVVLNTGRYSNQVDSLIDIIGKWEEPINEEELVESATKDCGRIVGMTGEITMSHVLQAYKKGYMKRVEEE